jgi:hypothetical protein
MGSLYRRKQRLGEARIASSRRSEPMQDGVPATGLPVTGNYFQVLGARAAMGRLITPSDATATGDGAVVVLSHAAWRWPSFAAAGTSAVIVSAAKESPLNACERGPRGFVADVESQKCP